MSYDYHKYTITKSNIDKVKENLPFEGKWNDSTGEVYSYPLEYDQDYKVQIRGEQFATVSGSLHKAAQNGFNYSDFTINDAAQETIRWVNHTGINPIETHVTTIEFGVNLSLPWLPNYIIDNLFFHSSKWFQDMTSIGKNAIYQEWRVKAYSKRKQWPDLVTGNVFRFENHYRNSAKIFSITGVPNFTLLDLYDQKVLNAFRKDLVRSWSNCYLLDQSFDRAALSRPKQKLFEVWDNPHSLKCLMENNPKKFRRERGIVMEVIYDNSQGMYHQEIKELIEMKLDELLEMDGTTIQDIAHLKSEFSIKNLVAFDTSNK